MEAIKNIINIDPEILGGQPVFKGTRVPVESLFLHLEKGISLDGFLDDFPTVSRELAVAILELAENLSPQKTLLKYMKLLLDDNLPKRLKLDFPVHEVFTVRDKGLNGKKNGELLTLMISENFDAFLTFDKNLQYQQNFQKYD